MAARPTTSSDEREERPENRLSYLYLNGFDLGVTLSDMSMVALLDGVPQIKIGMSFTTAKTLKVKLEQMITYFESATEYDLLTMEDVENAYLKAQDGRVKE